MRLHLETRWQRFIASIYSLSFFFSLIALFLTVIMLSRWGWLVYEEFEPTRQTFSTFGLFWGALLMGLKNAGTIFGPSVITAMTLRYVRNGEIAMKLYGFFAWALMEGYSSYVFATYFLDMCNDLFALYSILRTGNAWTPLTSGLIISVTIPIALFVFVLSFSFRIGRDLKAKRLQKKASK